ncbi:E3 ubiquitin-protein ligase TRIM39-like [Heptranchias perlo]|uniref:E3 ubiquitin-protein ligase TRIM39-like n=1 Tax=Heptranchias perlo TaxID=212740 RepID=UPI0035596CB6
MASEKELENIINEVICPVCLEFYNDPVMVDCGHNFCKNCILKYWEKQKGNVSCPKCREEFPQRNIRPNRFAANMVESVRKLSIKPREDNFLRCAQHDEKLKLFCENDRTAICVVCAVSREHKDHRINPLQDVAVIYKGKLKSALEFLNNQVDEIANCQNSQEINISELKKHADTIRKNIELEFAKLRQFLRDEEKLLMGKIKRKEDSILLQLEENLKAASSENALMNRRIEDIQKRLNLQEAELLKDIKSVLEGAEMPFIRPIDVNINLNLHEPTGPLQFLVWKRMLKVISPVPAVLTLNPQTAHPRLILSEDNTQVMRGDWKKLPDYPERFNFLLSVLALQGFTSGRHYWEIDVGNSTGWDVGVAKASVTRKAIPENGVWAVGLWDKEYTAFSSPRSPLALSMNPKRLGVYLDYEEGQVSFYNADNMTHIYTFSETFTETIYPYLSTESKTDPLKLVTFKV